MMLCAVRAATQGQQSEGISDYFRNVRTGLLEGRGFLRSKQARAWLRPLPWDPLLSRFLPLLILCDNGGVSTAVSHVTKRFGDLVAVNDLSFEICPGEIFGLLGPNGSGKTTTVRMILGLLEPDDGQVFVGGFDPQVQPLEVKRRIGYVSEEPILYQAMTPREVYELVASVRELDAETTQQRLERYLSSLDAASAMDTVIATLSRGNRQKVQVIAALLHQPELLILDEPLTGLDAKAVRVFKEIVALHRERGCSVLFSTHILEVAAELCTTIAIINKGKMVAMGTVAELEKRAQAAGASLEDVFLRLTEEDASVQAIVRRLREEG
jgi:ABC-2 type transport system ATP-binding protein